MRIRAVDGSPRGSLRHRRTARQSGFLNSPPREGAPAYRRERDLPGLLALWPSEVADRSLEGQRRLVALLRKALRVERQRGLAGHWTYDLSRHARLLQAYRCEQRRLEDLLALSGGSVTRPCKANVRSDGAFIRLGSSAGEPA